MSRFNEISYSFCSNPEHRQTDRQTNRQTDRITNHADRTTSALAKVIIGTISYGANIYLFGKKTEPRHRNLTAYYKKETQIQKEQAKTHRACQRPISKFNC